MNVLTNKTIILPIAEIEYHQIIDNKRLFKRKLDDLITIYPEIFPIEITNGYRFIGYSKNHDKLPVVRRIIRIKQPFNSYNDYLLHPCFILPYLKGKTLEVSQGLRLRKYSAPYHEIASIFGKNAMFWYRLETGLSSYNLFGTTIKRYSSLPLHILADEHHTKLKASKIYLCTVVGGNCFLSVDIAPTMKATVLEKAYGSFKKEAFQVAPNYQPISINIDGYYSTKKALLKLFPDSGILRCFLHSFLKIRNCGTKAYQLYFNHIAQKVWCCYDAESKRSFAQRVYHLEQWTLENVPNSPFKQSILKLCQKKRVYAFL